MTGYTKELEQDTEREKAKHERNMENLSKRKEELLRERKHKLKVRLSIWTHFCIQGGVTHGLVWAAAQEPQD